MFMVFLPRQEITWKEIRDLIMKRLGAAAAAAAAVTAADARQVNSPDVIPSHYE